MIWFTADHHFAHAKIIEYCARPFADVRIMDETLIARWNEVVDDSDTVYHLGDFTLKDRDAARRYFARLRGNIHVLGCHWHHDRRWLPDGFGIMLDLISASGYTVFIMPPMVVLEFDDIGDGEHPQAITLCHYPIAEWDRKHYGAWHLHGHSHGNYHYPTGKVLDIGVDCNHFRPVSLMGVERQMRVFAT